MRGNIRLFCAFFHGFWYTEACLFFPTFLLPSEDLEVCGTSAAPCEVSFVSLSFGNLLDEFVFIIASFVREVSLLLSPFRNLWDKFLSTTTFSVWFLSFSVVVAAFEGAALLTFKALFGQARYAHN